MPLPYILLIFLGFAGFLLAAYIYHTKKRHETMVCPLQSDCDAVVHSDYGEFFGIPVEILGMFYYLAVAIGYALFLAQPALATPSLSFAIIGLTTAALLFSLYLTFIQAFALRQWCTWCLASAGLCAVIFPLSLSTTQLSFVPLLAVNREIILGLHMLGIALGLGGATITDVLFFKFLKDFKISEFEAYVLRVLSQFIWFALAILVLSGIGLYLPDQAHYLLSSKFLAKMIVVLVIIVNGAFLNLLVSPKLVKISFGLPHQHEPGELQHLRRLAFALGAISLTSWYSAFILGAMHQTKLSLAMLLLIYAMVLFGAVLASQTLERSFARRRKLEVKK